MLRPCCTLPREKTGVQKKLVIQAKRLFTALAVVACASSARAVAQDNDRPVIQPTMWLSGNGTEFSVWSSLPVAQTSDGGRPQILELELTNEHEWGRLTMAPAVRMYFYHDALSADRDRSLAREL